MKKFSSLEEYWDSESLEWVVEGRNESYTNEQGIASFDWAFAGRTCAGEPCTGDWRIKAYYPGSTFFAESTDNITHEVHYMAAKVSDQSEGIFTPTTIMALVIVLLVQLWQVSCTISELSQDAKSSSARYFDRYNVTTTGC